VGVSYERGTPVVAADGLEKAGAAGETVDHGGAAGAGVGGGHQPSRNDQIDQFQTCDLPSGTLGIRVCQKANLKPEIGWFGLPVWVGGMGARKVDARLPGKGNSTPHGARPVHQIITMIKWIRTSRLSIKN